LTNLSLNISTLRLQSFSRKHGLLLGGLLLWFVERVLCTYLSTRLCYLMMDKYNLNRWINKACIFIMEVYVWI